MWNGIPQQGELFQVGTRVNVRGYGPANIETFVQEGHFAGKIKVRYDDGSFYHVRPEDLIRPMGAHSEPSSSLPPTMTREMAAELGLGEDEFRRLLEEHLRVEAEPRIAFAFQTGDRVHVLGYGRGTVESLLREGRFAGRIKVRYDDGTRYHVLEEQLRRDDGEEPWPDAAAH